VGTNVVEDLSVAAWPVFWVSLMGISMILITASLMGFIVVGDPPQGDDPFLLSSGLAGFLGALNRTRGEGSATKV
jgi:hypothetical protein